MLLRIVSVQILFYMKIYSIGLQYVLREMGLSENNLKLFSKMSLNFLISYNLFIKLIQSIY